MRPANRALGYFDEGISCRLQGPQTPHRILGMEGTAAILYSMDPAEPPSRISGFSPTPSSVPTVAMSDSSTKDRE